MDICIIDDKPICCGEYWNRQVQGIIGLMVTTVFQFGAYDDTLVPPQVPLFGSSMKHQFTVCQALVYTAILLIFVMLCTKPCMVKLQGTSHVQDEIEFQQVNQQDDNTQIKDMGYNQNRNQNPASINYTENRDMSSDDVFMKR